METQLQATNSNLQDQNQVHSNRLQANEQDTIPHMLNNEEFSQDDKQQLTGSDITIAMMASEDVLRIPTVVSVLPPKVTPIQRDSSSSDDDDDEPLFGAVAIESSDEEDESNNNKTKKLFPPRTKNETLEPSQPEVHVEIKSEHTLRLVGAVSHIVGDKVLIKATSVPIIDLDSVLCTQDKKVIGMVEDVIGPVKSPLYVVRPKSLQNDEEFSKDTPIYTIIELSTVVLPGTITARGSDASSVNDEEPPEEEVEFSDDEQEQVHKHKSKPQATRANRKNVQPKRKPDNHVVYRQHGPPPQRTNVYPSFNLTQNLAPTAMFPAIPNPGFMYNPQQQLQPFQSQPSYQNYAQPFALGAPPMSYSPFGSMHPFQTLHALQQQQQQMQLQQMHLQMQIQHQQQQLQLNQGANNSRQLPPDFYNLLPIAEPPTKQ